MNTQQRSKLERLKSGDSFKINELTGLAGMLMPLHYSTREAIIIEQEGSAILSIDEQQVRLERNNSYIIPAHKNHSLMLETEFKALVIMGLDSKIEFVNN